MLFILLLSLLLLFINLIRRVGPITLADQEYKKLPWRTNNTIENLLSIFGSGNLFLSTFWKFKTKCYKNNPGRKVATCTPDVDVH